MKNFLKVWFPGVNLLSAPRLGNKQKISFRIDPLSSNIRFYKDKSIHCDNILEEHTEWYKILTVQHTDMGDLYFSGAEEGLTKEEFKLLFDHFKKKGYKSAYYRHKHKELYCDLTKSCFNLTSL